MRLFACILQRQSYIERTVKLFAIVCVGVQLTGCPIDDGKGTQVLQNESEEESTSTRSQKFFSNTFGAAAFGKPIKPPSSMGNMTIDLLDQYVPISSGVSAEALPFYVAGGLRQMYLQSTTHETYGRRKFILHRMLDEPDVPIWANCGSSVNIMIIMLANFGIDARIVSIWHTLSDGHVALEFYSELFGKYVFYDPLYGAFMVDERGRPASVADLVDQIDQFGFDSEDWDYQPVRNSDVFSDDYIAAADSSYEYYNSRDYRFILENYFRVIAVREHDQTAFQYFGLGTAPGELYYRGGTWKVHQFVGGSEWDIMKDDLLQLFDVSQGGRYQLEFVEREQNKP